MVWTLLETLFTLAEHAIELKLGHQGLGLPL